MEGVNINITINKNALLLVGVVIVLVMSYFVFATTVNQNMPWHPLQQISVSSTNLTSIDENGDGVVDHTNATLQEITGNGAVTDRSITVGGLTSNGAVTVGGNLSVSSSANIGGDFAVSGVATFHKNLRVYEDLFVDDKVGIGTSGSIPDSYSKLYISGSDTEVTIDSSGYDNSAYLTFAYGGSKKWSIGQHIPTPYGGSSYNNDFAISNRYLNRVALTILRSNNYVGLGTVNPSYRLDLGEGYIGNGYIHHGYCYWTEDRKRNVCPNGYYQAGHDTTSGGDHMKIYCCKL